MPMMLLLQGQPAKETLIEFVSVGSSVRPSVHPSDRLTESPSCCLSVRQFVVPRTPLLRRIFPQIDEIRLPVSVSPTACPPVFFLYFVFLGGELGPSVCLRPYFSPSFCFFCYYQWSFHRFICLSTYFRQ